MSWSGYLEALAALASVDTKAATAKDRLDQRLETELGQLDAGEQAAAAETRATVEGLNELDRRLAEIEPGGPAGPAAMPRPPETLTELQERSRSLRQQVDQAEAESASLRRSLRRAEDRARIERAGLARQTVTRPSDRTPRTRSIIVAVLGLALALVVAIWITF